jgi:hypothetical protein
LAASLKIAARASASAAMLDCAPARSRCTATSWKTARN